MNIIIMFKILVKQIAEDCMMDCYYVVLSILYNNISLLTPAKTQL